MKPLHLWGYRYFSRQSWFQLVFLPVQRFSWCTLHMWKCETESLSVVSDSLWPMDCTVYGLLQARILEWVAFPFSRGSSWPRKWTRVSCIAGGFFTNWAVTKYRLGVFLSQFWTSLLFHVWFCYFLTCIQVSQETGKEAWYSHLLKNFPQFLWSTHSKALA